MVSSGCQGQEAEVLAFTCAGAAYSGQIANRVGVLLAQEGVARLFCTAAVAARIPDKLQRAGAAAGRIVIDGCDAHCARKVLEAADLPVDLHVDVTALGLEKQPENPHFVLHTRRVADHARTTLSASASKQ
ncbi:MAG: putative zinc-binding protein [Phycisphaerales bacterium]|nr:putative zinc-binding protein [Phycisphaerales bacterium]